MSDEHFYPPRWSGPRGPRTVGIRVSVYLVVAAVAVIAAFALGSAHDENASRGCDSSQFECDDEIGMLVPFEWALAALAAVIVIAALSETALAIRRRQSQP